MLCSTCSVLFGSALILQDHLQCFSSSWGRQSPVFDGKETAIPLARRKLTYTEKSLSLVPGWPIFMQMRTQIIGVWLVQKALSSVFRIDLLWLAGKNTGGYKCIPLNGWEKSQSYWLKYNFINSFIRVGSDVGQEHSKGGRQCSAGYSLKHGLREAAV